MWLSPYILLLFLSVSAHAEEDDIGCGAPKPFSAYEFEVGELVIRLPKFLEVLVGGKSVYSSDEKLVWDEAAMSAQYFKFKNYVFIVTQEGDCIDLIDRRLLSFDTKKPKSIKSYDILTGHHRDSFFTHSGDLFYWSEWFCMKEQNKEAKENGAYLFKFNSVKGNFEKVFFKLKSVCYPTDVEKSRHENEIRELTPKIVK